MLLGRQARVRDGGISPLMMMAEPDALEATEIAGGVMAVALAPCTKSEPELHRASPSQDHR
jgi:hypothetical protein